jgi:large subunit ribosomal protein L10
MPLRIPIRPSQWRRVLRSSIEPTLHIRTYASIAVAAAPANSNSYDIIPEIAVRRHNPQQPPSHRRPDVRKTQLLRQYVALLRTSPVVLLFQHNSLLATELTAIRTLLKTQMRKVDEAQKTEYGDHIKLQVMRTGLLDTALRLADFWHPEPQDANRQASTELSEEMRFTHALSEEAFQALTENPQIHGLEPLLSGPIAALSIPWMSPEHLKVALSILSPSPEIPAPKRRAMPAYYEPSVQNGIPKLLLLGARIEGRAMDTVKTRWVGNVAGGIDGLRAQLVATLQGVSGGLVNTLESGGKSLYFTLEGRRTALEKESAVENKSE